MSWVNVHEKLPELQTRVLVCHSRERREYVLGVADYGLIHGLTPEEKNLQEHVCKNSCHVGFTFGNNIHFGFEVYEITHWMNPPAQPKDCNCGQQDCITSQFSQVGKFKNDCPTLKILGDYYGSKIHIKAIE